MKNIKLDDLQGLSLFSNLNNETLIRLINNGEKRRVKKGEHIFRDKDENLNIYVVLNGKVALYKLNESAQKRVIFILGEGKLINEVILEDLPSSINCDVFENGEILVFNKKGFIDAMKEDFQLTSRIVNSLSINIRRLYRQIKNATPIKVEKKLAAKLWRLSKDYGVEIDEGILIDLNMSITYLADMFGTSRETISRAMKVLQEKELVKLRNKRIIIKNREGLSNYFKGI